MTRSEAPEFFQMLTALGELFGAKLSWAAQTLYFNALRDLTIEEISDAVSNCSRKLKFMPKPVEIRENVYEFGAISLLESGADEAWTNSRYWLSHGIPKDIDSSSIVNAVEAAFGSWRSAAMGEFSGDVLESKRRAFISAWKREQLELAECRRSDKLDELDAIDRSTGLLPAEQQKLIER